MNQGVTAFLLAGGLSSRMGEDKGLMPWQDTTMAGRVIDTLRQCFEDIVILSNDGAYWRFGLPLIPDLVKGMGPAGGILTGLRNSQTALNFFIACDMPLITPEVISFILKNSKAGMITVPLMDNRKQPLCAVYPSSITDEWERQTAMGIIKMHELLDYFNTRLLKLDGFPAGHLAFANINTKSEYNQLNETK